MKFVNLFTVLVLNCWIFPDICCPTVLCVPVFFQSYRCDILNIVSLQFSLQGGEEWGHMRPKVWLTRPCALHSIACKVCVFVPFCLRALGVFMQPYAWLVGTSKAGFLSHHVSLISSAFWDGQWHTYAFVPRVLRLKTERERDLVVVSDITNNFISIEACIIHTYICINVNCL